MNSSELVRALYLALLGREADQPGLAAWTELIDSTGDPSLVFRGILASDEYQKHTRAGNGPPSVPPAIYELRSPPICRPTAERVEMTTSCRDTDSIPKAAGAGEVFIGPGNVRCQRMHNGVVVAAGGYYGDWMSEIIYRLKGHHEPQEELLFHAAAPWMAADGARPVMVELGAFWSYYSLWFRTVYPDARNIVVEPDSENLNIGKQNFALNGFHGEFVEAATGAHNETMSFHCASDGVVRTVRTASVDGLAKDLDLERIHLLHADIQGAELKMLAGLEETIQQKKLDWLFLSTHHHSISGDPLTHQRCLAWIQDHGAAILEEHSVSESFSGDGLIVARFGTGGAVRLPPVSRNIATKSLFRETEYDLAEADGRIQQLRAKLRRANLNPD